MRKILSDKQEDFLKRNYLSMTYREMCNLEMFKGINEKQLRSRARNMGLKKKREFNKDYFELVDSNEKAYWLGFIYADGWVTEYGELGIELEESDSYILELLNSDLGNVHQINHREREKEFNDYKFTSKTSVLRVYSKKIVGDLFNNGIVFRKTYDKEFPRVEKKYFFHFLRGFMDGDGCISNNVLSFTGANRDFFEYLKNFILEEFSFKSSIYKEKENKYRLIFNKSETEKILPQIYHNCGSHCLQRKKDLYLGSPPRKL